MSRNRHFILIGIFITSFLIWIWSIYRPLHLQISYTSQHYIVKVDGRTILNALDLSERDNNISPVTLDISHDKYFGLISLVLPSTINHQELLNTVPFFSAVRAVFLPSTIPYIGEILYSNNEFQTTHVLSNPTNLSVITYNPVSIHLTNETSQLFLRPQLHHEAILTWNQQQVVGQEVGREWITLTKLFLEPILLTILLTIVLFYILLCASFLLRRLKFFPFNLKIITLHILKPYRYYLVGLVAFTFFTFTLLLNVLILDGIPHSQDEVAYLFQSRIFASGNLFANSAPEEIRRFFDQEFIVNNGNWYSAFPIGYSLLLAIGQVLSTPFVVNSFLGSLALVLLFLIAEKIYTYKEGFLAVIFFLFSPFYLLLSSSYFSHPTALVAVFSAIYALHQKHYKLAGIAFGLLIITRPYTALVYLCIPVFYFATRFYQRKHFFKPVLSFGVGTSIFIIFQAFYNYTLTRSVFTLPYNVYSEFNRIGFGLRGNEWGSMFTPIMGFENTLFNFFSLQDMLTPFPAIFAFLFIPFAFMTNKIKYSIILIILFFILVIAHVFYFAKGTFYGPRLWYEGSIFLLLLSAHGVISLLQHTTHITKVLFGTVFIFLLAVSVVYKYNQLSPLLLGYNGMSKTPIPALSNPSIIIVEGNKAWQQYGSYFYQQSPLFTDNVIVVRDQALHNVPSNLPPLDNLLLRKYFPNRVFYRLSPSNEIVRLE